MSQRPIASQLSWDEMKVGLIIRVSNFHSSIYLHQSEIGGQAICLGHFAYKMLSSVFSNLRLVFV